jgi:GNAT superfamily N-acetyltransferase
VSARDQSGDLSIRGAVLTDASRLASLSETLGYPVAPSVLEERLRGVLARGDLVLVAERGAGVVLGWVHASIQDPLESDRQCEILGLVVDAAHRGGGVGRRLVEAVEQWASQQAIDQMTVRSNVARAGSHPFYERLGYGRVKTQHVYRKRLRD